MIELTKLTVASLRGELKKRGHSTDGLKAALIQRLRAVLEDESAASMASAAKPDGCRDSVAPVRRSAIQATSPAATSPDSSKGRGAEPRNPKTLRKAGKVSHLRSEHNDMVDEGADFAYPTRSSSHALEEHATLAGDEIQVKKREQQFREELEGPKRQRYEGERLAKDTPYSSIGNRTKADNVHTKRADNLPDRLSKNSYTRPSCDSWRVNIVTDIYSSELGAGKKIPCTHHIRQLEKEHYFENLLWPNFDAREASAEHVLLIMMIVNEKSSENLDPWVTFHTSGSESFASFFYRVITLEKYRDLTLIEKGTRLVFLIHAFQSLEDEEVRKTLLPFVSLTLWANLSPWRLQAELTKNPQLQKYWKHLMKKEAKASNKVKKSCETDLLSLNARVEVTWLSILITDFLETCSSINFAELDGIDIKFSPAIRFCERFIELVIDLLSQLPTRRFVRAVLDDRQVLVKARMMPLFSQSEGRLYRGLVDLFMFYQHFEVDDHTGLSIAEDEIATTHYDKLRRFQRLCFVHYTKLYDLSLSHCGAIEGREDLIRHLSVLNANELHNLVTKQLKMIGPEDPWASDLTFLLEVIVNAFQRRQSRRQAMNQLPLYPNEEVIMDENIVPSIPFTGERCLALPKLNLQFLSLADYLLRNFNLFRLESTHEIREDIADVLRRMGPQIDNDTGELSFSGWARMALPIASGSLAVIEVHKPKIGEAKPSRVICEVKLDLRSFRVGVQKEWAQLKKKDVLFMLAVDEVGAASEDDNDHSTSIMLQRCGLKFVRGAEVVEVRCGTDLVNNRVNECIPPSYGDFPKARDDERTIVLSLDAAQYHLDVSKFGGDADVVYGALNVIMRRKPKENNFKPVLECIRDLMNDTCDVPSWLHDTILGYGDPGKVHSDTTSSQVHRIDFKDTFLDTEHLEESFPGHELVFTRNCQIKRPGFRVTFPNKSEMGNAAKEAERLLIEPYEPIERGAYPGDMPRLNEIRFTPSQVNAIRAGVQQGLTLIVGPPGTGKTDTAAQILQCLYHNEPKQRILVITHSNGALNDLFQKLYMRDIPERYLLRLGQGESDLATHMDFSRIGRVNAMLNRRLELLAEVERLAISLGVSEDMAYTCETASHFWLLHVVSRWEKFETETSNASDPNLIRSRFPFTEYFSGMPQPLFHGQLTTDISTGRGCMRYIRNIFTELEECRAFELLKDIGSRSNYLLTKQAKVIAMTCTHAAMKRRDFMRLGFKYDSLIIEESAQILEIETFIPIVLQKAENGSSRLKRVILIGDHHQLPPVVKNPAFQKYCKMDQSMFGRLIRLGVPSIQLNAQGRARPEIAKLFSWKYRDLDNLPCTANGMYELANPGFAHEMQFINVDNFCGSGETEPTPHFYQNIGEAEYIVNVYQYMRLLGYPASKISIITTYRGQKHLIRDIVTRRCTRHPLFGVPSRITTVDKFQGQQNDYVLLSLVRTRHIGHMRDIRRLIVALSRARLGLYIFGRETLFKDSIDLSPSFQHLFKFPTKLGLVPTEAFPGSRRKGENRIPYLVEDPVAMGCVVNQLVAKYEADDKVEQQYYSKVVAI